MTIVQSTLVMMYQNAPQSGDIQLLILGGREGTNKTARIAMRATENGRRNLNVLDCCHYDRQ